MNNEQKEALQWIHEMLDADTRKNSRVLLVFLDTAVAKELLFEEALKKLQTLTDTMFCDEREITQEQWALHNTAFNDALTFLAKHKQRNT